MTTNYSPSRTANVTMTEAILFDRNTRVRKVTIASGAAHLRGEAVAEGGRYILSIADAGNGSEIVHMTLLHEFDVGSPAYEAMIEIGDDFATQGIASASSAGEGPLG